MSRPNEWSGLAPAVDAHLSLWAHRDRAIQFANAFDETRHHDDFARWINTVPGLSWTKFAASYGVIGENGAPMADILTLDGETISGREQMRADHAAIQKGVSLAQHEHEMLARGVSHYVSAEVVAEISEAASLAHNEPIYDTDVFTPHGFAVLETPAVFSDLHPYTGEPSDIEVHIRAVGWTLIDRVGTTTPGDLALKPGVMVFLYTTRDDFTNGYFRTCIDNGIEPPYGPEVVEDGFIPMEVLSWQFGRPWDTRPGAFAHIPGTVPSTVGEQRRWFYAFQRLMWQRIIVPQRASTNRQTARRWERDTQGRKPVLDYTVLRLRRAVDPNYEPTGTGAPLEHRVKVRGHWKFVYLPGSGIPARDENGAQIPESHRWMWIEAHWKGPEDGPVGAMEWATAVIR
jgi:hypothetical protein